MSFFALCIDQLATVASRNHYRGFDSSVDAGERTCLGGDSSAILCHQSLAHIAQYRNHHPAQCKDHRYEWRNAAVFGFNH
jgi:hypothetical protein